MRNQVIKSGALLLLVLATYCAEPVLDEGKKVVIVLPYYKHEVQAIYFKEPSSSGGPANQEQYSNYLSSKPMGIKVWVEKSPPSAERTKGNGFPYNYNANNGVGFSDAQSNGNRPGSSAWPGNQAQWSENQGGNFPSQLPGNRPEFSGNQPPWSEYQPGFSGNESPKTGNQPGFSANQPSWPENQPGFSGVQPPTTGKQPGYPRNQPSWSGTQPGFTGNQPAWSSGNQPDFSGNWPTSSGVQPGFSANQPPRAGNHPGFSGNKPPWSGNQPGFSGNNFQPQGNEGSGYNKYLSGGSTQLADSYSSSWSSMKVFPAIQGMSLQSSTRYNSQNPRWPNPSGGKHSQGWNVGWKGDRAQQGVSLQPPNGMFVGERGRWENQEGPFLAGGGNGWQSQGSPGNSLSWQSQGSRPGGSANGNGNVWNQDVNGSEYEVPRGSWETQSQEEWEKNQQGGTSTRYSPPESATWREGGVVLDQEKWPKTTATSPAQGWAAANEVNDGLRGGCPPGVGGNNCFREPNNGLRVSSNHQDGFGSEKSPDGVIGGWNGPLQNGEGNAANNYEEISLKSGKPDEIYMQGENSYSGSGYATKGNQDKNFANNFNALGINNYRLRESQGVSSNFALGDNRSNRNGKYESSDDAEVYIGQDSYGVVINHGNSDFYRNSRKADIVSGGKFPVIDSFSSATFGGAKTRVKATLGDKEKRGKASAFADASEFGKKLKVAKRLKKAGVDDLTTS